MNLKEKLEAKKAELVNLKAKIEAEDSEAIKKAGEIGEEIEKLETEIKAAEKAKTLLLQIGEKKSEEQPEEETGIKALAKRAKSLKNGKGSVYVYIKAATDLETAPTIPTIDQRVVDPQTRLRVRELFGAESISGNALTYFVLGATEGTIGTVAEGAKKSQIHIPYEPKTVALQKIAGYIKETDELLEDAAFLESAIRNRAIFEYRKAVENYLVTTLLGTSGVQTGGNAITFDNILAAKQDIFADTGYEPDAMIVNPSDWATLLHTKDGNQQYLLGGPAFGAYGNGNYFANPRVWGLTVVESAAVAAGKAVVGAFKTAATVVTKAGEGFRVEVANQNEDDFVKNLVTVRFEERMVEAVRVPAAFSIIGQ